MIAPGEFITKYRLSFSGILLYEIFFFFFLGGIVKVIEDYYMKEILHAKICAGFCGNNLMSPPELHVAIFLQ